MYEGVVLRVTLNKRETSGEEPLCAVSCGVRYWEGGNEERERESIV